VLAACRSKTDWASQPEASGGHLLGGVGQETLKKHCPSVSLAHDWAAQS
jgi:hypothetical protein